MDKQRRQLLCFLSHLYVASSSSLITPYAFGRSFTNNDHYLSAYTDRSGQHGIALFNQLGQIIFGSDLPTRGHGFSINPYKQHIYCIDRRPATNINVLSFSGKHLMSITADKNRHFYGHASISPDGNFLYTPENNIITGEGVISVRDINNSLSIIKEISSGGIGPHDIKTTTDSRFLVVANGGIRTDPAFGRKKLNLDSMRPSLVFIDRISGEINRKVQLDEKYRFNSIRHLKILKNNDAIVALQHQKKTTENEVLLAYYDYLKDRFSPIRLPNNITQEFNHYLGDIVLDRSQESLASTSPKGGTIVFIHLRSQQIWIEQLPDACGVQCCSDDHSFIITSGNGSIIKYHIDWVTSQMTKIPLQHYTNIQWDNHIAHFPI